MSYSAPRRSKRRLKHIEVSTSGSGELKVEHGERVENERGADGEQSTIKKEEDRESDYKRIKIETGIAAMRYARAEDEDLESSDAKQPKDWYKIYNEVALMREHFESPVDTMGCESIPNTIRPGLSEMRPQVYRFQLLVSLILSSQTKDEVTYNAMLNLNRHLMDRGFEDGLTLEAVLTLSETEVDGLISKVGFHRKKAAYILKSAAILKETAGSDVPQTVDEITRLPGVGPKMAYLLIQRGWNINDGIGVDVHVHRLAQMWRWVPKSDNPERTRLALQAWLPRKFWPEINPLLVGFGQVVCVPRAGNCDICTLATKRLCPSANRSLANTPLTPDRIAKLDKGRGSIKNLVLLNNLLKEKELF
ncbi:Piso0_002778 [Millerozyma farinosa CBS 7064]|uniref:Endonuclease III homolog n=1 Tax=Pichia sorbitophila (strain ATCC MYA-4447 / BCRC 22081 / CBS 7064 / NBRC 10061 / NRRL Y-12695) TaxID=559304 RepID=G8YDH4_PICSO|nr:Piso0_002778 [Millerozyma farinosa CBS 7064]